MKQHKKQISQTFMERFLRRSKYYIFINAFICTIGITSYSIAHQLVANSLWKKLPLAYLAVLLRITLVILWFEWIGTKKRYIYGAKRIQLKAIDRQRICQRILWLIIPTEIISLCMGEYITFMPNTRSLTIGTFLMDYLVFIPKSLLFEIVFDFFHYAAHWICHAIPWLYKNVHKRHHIHLHPCALSTYEQDGFDLILTNVIPMIMASSFSFPLTPLQFHLLLAYKTYVEVAGHSGLEIKGYSFPQFPWLEVLLPTSVCLAVRDHDFHHTNPKWNFAKRFALWDKIFGTFRPAPDTSALIYPTSRVA